jgi:hypothetical protein
MEAYENLNSRGTFSARDLEALANLYYQGQPSKLSEFSKQLVLDFINAPLPPSKKHATASFKKRALHGVSNKFKNLC